MTSILQLGTSGKIKNTGCLFSMTIKTEKDGQEYSYQILQEWNHNQPLNILQVNSFKEISPERTV